MFKPLITLVRGRAHEAEERLAGQHSQAWVTSTYVSFILSLTLIGGGVAFMPVDIWMKRFLGMGILLVVQSCITLTKTVRYNQEAGKLVNRIEDAKTERLLMDAGKVA